MKRCTWKSRSRWIVFGVLVAMGLGLAAPSAWALGAGAPPVVTFAAAWVNANPQRFGGSPQLIADVQVEIPGGNVPLNVASVTVTLPDGVTTFPMPLQRLDLAPEREYFVNLTQAGVIGFPSGTYTFKVTDTSATPGVTTVLDTFTAPGTPLAPTSGISVSGTTQVTNQLGYPPNITYPLTYTLDLSLNPTPTVTWNAVAGAAIYQVRIQVGGLDQEDREVFIRNTTSTSMTLPAGVMVPGRRYRVRIDADDNVSLLPAANSRSQNDLEILTLGPTIFLTFGTGKYTAGQVLDVTARIYNTGPAVTVNAKAWIGLPNGAVIEILNLKGLAIPNSEGNATGPNNFYSGTIGFSYMFTGTEPPGNYVVGLIFLDPGTFQTVALTTSTFAK